jgi:hypothetical protein
LPAADPTIFFESVVLRRRSSSAAMDKTGLSDQSVDWVESIRRANEELVGPALATTIADLKAVDRVPDDVRDYLALLLDKNTERNERVREQCMSVGRLLAAAGVQAVLLKGATWLFEDGPSRRDRMMRDIDVLVAEEHLEAAMAALRAAGYTASNIYAETGHLHEVPLYIDGGLLLEVHTALTTRDHMLTGKEMIAGATPVAPGLASPSPGHRIIHNVLHAQIMNGDYWSGAASLRDALDLSRLMVAFGAKIDWPQLVQDATERGYFRELSGAVYLATTFAGAPLPQIFATDVAGARHAARCRLQRRWPWAERLFRHYGVLRRALAWERDAYALRLGSDKGLRAHLSVNARRAGRIYAAVRRSLTEH